MKHYVFWLSNGEIETTSTLPDDIDPTLTSSLPYIQTESPVSGQEYWVSSGVVVRYSDQGILSKKMYPGTGWEWRPSLEQWVDCRSVEAKEAEVRSRRSVLLASTDWTQLPDVPSTTKEAWAIYRQALRDITDQSGFPLNIVWPAPPG